MDTAEPKLPEPPKPQIQIQCDVPCSSKTATFIENLNKDELDDDRQIAELLQAEFDLEYDEEIKRLENARNKSKNSYIKLKG